MILNGAMNGSSCKLGSSIDRQEQAEFISFGGEGQCGVTICDAS